MTETAARDARATRSGSEARFCLCESYARVTERAALAGARWLGRADQETAEEDAVDRRCALALEQLPIDGKVVIGAGGETSQLAAGDEARRGRARGRPRARPARRPRRRRARRLRRDVDGGRRRPGLVPDAAGHVHAQDGRRPEGARRDRPRQAGRRQHPRDRRRVRADGQRHHDDRPRPAAPPRPDRGDPRRRRAHQADPGRRRDRLDLGRDPRHERPPRDRDRRHAPGGALRGGAALPRRRAPGAAVADLAQRDRGGARGRASTTSSGSSRSTTSRPAR